jgi:hypothetical protein
MNQRVTVCVGALALVCSTASVASADFVSFEIRGTPGIQTNNTYTPGAIEFIIDAGGEKAALGSSDIDGSLLGDLLNVSIVRWDDESRFTAGSGPAVAPYLNFWITDGTNFAVVANEPSNPDFQALYNNGYSLSFADLSDKVAKVYENADTTWLPNNGVGLTFADLAGFTIMAPSTAQLTTGWAGLGTGAPRELGTNQAYGVNWVFGDTLANYVSGDEGYVVSGASVTAAPEPATLALLGVGGLVLGGRLRRRTSRS